MKTLSKNKKLAIATVTVLVISILAVSIGLVINAVEKSRNVVADTENGQLLSGKVYDMPKQLTLTDVADGEKNEGVNLTVKLKPSFVSNAKINFSLKWKDKTVQDDINTFLTLTTVSDTQCNIKIAQRFNNQIELVATAELDSSITKTCQIDCYSYLECLDYTLNFDSHKYKTTEKQNLSFNNFGFGSNQTHIDEKNIKVSLDNFNPMSISLSANYTFGAGTVLYFNGVTLDFYNFDNHPGYKLQMSKNSTQSIDEKTGEIKLEVSDISAACFYWLGNYNEWYQVEYHRRLEAGDSSKYIPEYVPGYDFIMENIQYGTEIANLQLAIYFSYANSEPEDAIKNQLNYACRYELDSEFNHLRDISFDDSILLS